MPRAPIFIDSPLACKATDDLLASCEVAAQWRGACCTRSNSPYVKTTESVDESKAIARFSGFHIIVAASGMCEAGRIRHHLKNNLFRPNATVLLVGFQAEGSLGRLLEDGAASVRIHGEEVKVRAAIRRFEDYSGHADGPELLQWLREATADRQRRCSSPMAKRKRQIALPTRWRGKIVAAERIVRPRLDDVYDLSGEAPVLLAAETRPRISPDKMATPRLAQ